MTTTFEGRFWFLEKPTGISHQVLWASLQNKPDRGVKNEVKLYRDQPNLACVSEKLALGVIPNTLWALAANVEEGDKPPMGIFKDKPCLVIWNHLWKINHKHSPWTDNPSSQLWGAIQLVKGLPQIDQRFPPQQGPTLRHTAIFILENKANGVGEVGKWNRSPPGVTSHEGFKEI